MNLYRAWVSGQKEATLEHIEAESSFFARLKIANKYRLKTFDCVAQRVTYCETCGPDAGMAPLHSGPCT